MSFADVARAAAYASQADKAALRAFGHVEQSLDALRRANLVRGQVESLLKSLHISFRWIGTRLDLMGPDGEWVEGPDLRGSVSTDGAVVAGHIAVFADASGDLLEDGGELGAENIPFAPAGGLSATNVQAALIELEAEKAPLASPQFTGAPSRATALDPANNSNDLATTAWARNHIAAAIDALLDGAPSALNTLNELAAAINDDASFAAAVMTALAAKANAADMATALAAKANASDMTTALAAKADQATTYTKIEVDAAITAAASSSVLIQTGGSFALTAASPKFVKYTPNASFCVATLPNATTLTVGAVWRLHNPTQTAFYVAKHGGGKLATVKADDTVVVTLVDNTSAAGVWAIASRKDQPLAFTNLSNIVVNPASLASVTLLSATALLISYRDTANNHRKAVVATISGSTVTAVGTSVTLNSSVTAGIFFSKVVALSATLAIAVTVDDIPGSGSSRVHGLTISGTTITVFGTTFTYNSYDGDGSQKPVRLSSTQAIVPASGNLRLVSWTGSALTDQSNLGSPSNKLVKSVSILSSTAFVYATLSAGAVTTVAVTISGTTMTQGSETSIGGIGTATNTSICALDSSSFIVTAAGASTALRRYTVSGTTQTLAENADFSTALSLRLTQLSSTRALAWAADGYRTVELSPLRLSAPTEPMASDDFIQVDATKVWSIAVDATPRVVAHLVEVN